MIHICDDFFENPNNIRRKGLIRRYFKPEDHPHSSGFPGVRTRGLCDIDETLFNKITLKVGRILGYNGIRVYSALCYSITNKDTLLSFHRDKQWNIGGVVYLNPDIAPDCGTIVAGQLIPAKYNRLILYDGSLIHSPAKSFGTNRFNSRMVLTLFFKKLE